MHRTPLSVSKPTGKTMALAVRRHTVTVAVSAAFAWPYSAVVYALPTGGQVAAGTASITQPNAQTVQITQGTLRAILNWQGFSIGASESVMFQQPNAASIAYNRVLGTNPSEIFGRLTANGQIFLINPSGRFEIGGPKGDAGLTGRKIIVDTYGGAARHGGGAFSGKDPSKVDRSGAYAMRWVAKNAVAAGLADRLEVQIAYAIGRAAPVGLYVETFGTGAVSDETIIDAIREVFDLRPAAIIRDLDLLKPRYAQTATYGHFGRELPGFTWERLDRVDDLRSAAGL